MTDEDDDGPVEFDIPAGAAALVLHPNGDVELMVPHAPDADRVPEHVLAITEIMHMLAQPGAMALLASRFAERIGEHIGESTVRH